LARTLERLTEEILTRMEYHKTGTELDAMDGRNVEDSEGADSMGGHPMMMEQRQKVQLMYQRR